MCIKIVFQWRPYRGEGILATVVKYILAAYLSGHQWCQGKSPEYFICIFVFQINRLGTPVFVKYSPHSCLENVFGCSFCFYHL